MLLLILKVSFFMNVHVGAASTVECVNFEDRTYLILHVLILKIGIFKIVGIYHASCKC